MHYSEHAFSKSSNVKTMTSKQPNIPLGRSTGLSPLDVIQTQLLYKEQCGELLQFVGRDATIQYIS